MDNGVLILDTSNHFLSGFIRTLVGTWEENDTFLAGYLKILETGD